MFCSWIARDPMGDWSKNRKVFDGGAFASRVLAENVPALCQPVQRMNSLCYGSEEMCTTVSMQEPGQALKRIAALVTA